MIPLRFTHPATQRAHETVLRHAPDAVLVGGAVRDLLLGLPLHDLDYVLPGDALAVARAVANALGAAYYPLDAARGVGRVVWDAGEADVLVLDLSSLGSKPLVEDLRTRDFTINAIACLPDGEWFDPLHGAEDLRAGKLRLCSEHSLIDDPIRVLRAIRFLLTFQLEPADDLVERATQAAHRLPSASPERQRDEFLRLLALAAPDEALVWLDAWGVTPLLTPDWAALRGVAQRPPHIYDAFEHTRWVVHWMARIDQLLRGVARPQGELETALLAALAPFAPDLTHYLDDDLATGRPRWLWLRFAALTHDWGKATTLTMDEMGQTRFFGHEEVSERLAVAWMAQYRCAAAEIQFVRRVCAGHMRPAWLGDGPQPPSRRSLHRLYRDLDDATPGVILLHLADFIGTSWPQLSLATLQSRLEFAITLLTPAFVENADIVPPPLIDGHALMAALDLPPGPRVGELLAQLCEAQAAGDVADREQAFAFVRALANEQSTSEGSRS